MEEVIGGQLGGIGVRDTEIYKAAKSFTPKILGAEFGPVNGTIKTYSNFWHLTAGRANTVGSDLWNAAKAAGVPFGPNDPFKSQVSGRRGG